MSPLKFECLCSSFNSYSYFFFSLASQGGQPVSKLLSFQLVIWAKICSNISSLLSNLCVGWEKHIQGLYSSLLQPLLSARYSQVSPAHMHSFRVSQGYVKSLLSLYGSLFSKVWLLNSQLVPHSSQLAPQHETCKYVGFYHFFPNKFITFS